jgi:hypothetical protein
MPPTAAEREPNTSRFNFVDGWGYSVNGQPLPSPTGALPVAAIPDVPGTATLAQTITTVNLMLAALRTAGIILP